MTGVDKSEQPVVETIFFTGYAKLPSNITAAKLYEVVAIGVEVNSHTGEVIACDCTLATKVARNFVNSLIVGYNLSKGIDELTDRFERRYYGSARKALTTSLKIMYDKWLAYKENSENEIKN